MSHDVLIRQLSPSDATDYRELRLRALAEHPQAFTSSVEEERDKPLAWSSQRLATDASKPHDLFLGAWVGGRLCGMAGLQGRYRTKERHNATVVGMYVAPECAGKGLGRGLLQGLIARARAEPVLLQLDLTVTAGNPGALALYAGCGFVEFGRLHRAIRVGDEFHDKIHMSLVLR
jgi:RimJ/RimL family protein N-acetyltransferase